MVQPNQSRINLEKFSISELRAECDKLSIPLCRSKEDCITDIWAAQPQVVAQAELNAYIEEQAEAVAPEQQRLEKNQQGYRDAVEGLICQSNDPCYQVGYDRGMRDITPVPLKDSGSEAIAFEKVADGRWQANVNGVVVRIASVQGGYKTNLTDDAMLVDFGIAIKEALLGVARLQQRQLIERIERAETINVLEQNGNEFVVENPANGNHYIVRPNHPEVNQRCECADCFHRSSKCKHQIAVEKFLEQRLVAA